MQSLPKSRYESAPTSFGSRPEEPKGKNDDFWLLTTADLRSFSEAN
jgi:hypothetical protein